MQSQIKVNATYLTKPTSDVNGIIGIKINGVGEVDPKQINIALLMDTSGSMEGARIESVKKTLKVLVEILSNGDVITLIGFSSEAKEILSNVTIDDSNRSFIIEEIEKLQADGGTDLGCALMKMGDLQGCIRSSHNAVVILTDGFINKGITSNAGLYSLVKSKIPSLPIYTLGYGDDHNSDLMKTLSTKTRGSYSFIQEEISLPESLGDMVGALKTEISSNATVKFPSEWKCLEPIAEEGNTFSVGSIISNKSMWVMIKVPAGSIDKPMELTCIKSKNETSTITFNSDDSLERMELVEQLVRCDMGKIMNDVTELMKINELNKAKDVLSKAINSLTTSEAKNRNIVILIKAQMEEILSKVNDALSEFHSHTPNALLRHASNTTSNYGNQRGRTGGGELFSSPMQGQYSRHMTARYADEPTNPTPNPTQSSTS